MKRQIILGALFLIGGIGAQGQNVYDAANIINKDLSGTARFVGMGGAMGALGGDISTIGTNPAGIGLFRSNDINTSFSFSTLNTESKYNGSTFSTDKNRWDLNNIGAVFTTKIGDQGSLRYVNFGFNYQRSKSFYRNMNMAGDLGGMSQTFFMASASDKLYPSYWDNGNHYNNNDIGWLSALGYDGYLINPSETTSITDYPLKDANGNQIKDKDGNPLFLNYDFFNSIVGNSAQVRDFHSRERGGIDQYDFNVALNFNDRAYFGLTIGAYNVDYTKNTYYDEDFGNGEGYTLQSWNNISGTGFDFKLGTILRPFEYSPLRIGLAIHTPVFYNLTLATSARMESDVHASADATNTTRHIIDTQNQLNGDMKMDFRINTPWKYNLSLGYTFGSNLALGAEYEYQDYSTTRFKDGDGNSKGVENDEAKYAMKGVNTFRIGAEYKVIPEFAFRLGYNYTSAIFKKDAVKALPINSIQTDTDFANLQAMNTYTIGVGYRGSSFYADLAYKYSIQKSDFYPFWYPEDVVENGQIVRNLMSPDATKVKDSRSQVLLTLGFRF
jgi:Long-chain fatty acid transport protein